MHWLTAWRVMGGSGQWSSPPSSLAHAGYYMRVERLADRTGRLSGGKCGASQSFHMVLFLRHKDPLSSQKAGVACGEGTQSITELTHSLVPPLCEDVQGKVRTGLCTMSKLILLSFPHLHCTMCRYTSCGRKMLGIRRLCWAQDVVVCVQRACGQPLNGMVSCPAGPSLGDCTVVRRVGKTNPA